jgi:exopolysaccharide biosynthesis polyprenyl glycosylphosphotransferase
MLTLNSTQVPAWPHHEIKFGKQQIAPILLLLDGCSILASWVLANAFYSKLSLSIFNPFLIAFFVLFIIGLYLADAYRPDSQIAGLRAPFRILLSGVFITTVLASLIYFSSAWDVWATTGRKPWMTALILSIVCAVLSRLWVVRWIRDHARQSSWLILGMDDLALQFARDVVEKNHLARFCVVTSNRILGSQLAELGIGIVEDLTLLPTWVTANCSGVLLSNQTELSDAQGRQLMQLRLQGVPVYRLPDFYETLWFKLPARLLHDDWFMFSTGFNLLPGAINFRIKRLTDVIFSATALVGLSPLMLLLGIVVKLDSSGPMFYSQLRNGLNRQPFRVYKFRSMRQDAEKAGAMWASKRDPRITRVGNVLRLTRLDELPQLWNVLRGDMSLIGPRPERPEFDDKLSCEIPYYDVRYLVQPGITGWAQVMYPYGASVEDAYEKLSYDLYYIKNYSIWIDIAICFKTIRVVLLGKGR